MKFVSKTLIALAAASVVATSASASVGSVLASGQPYIGVKVGQVDIDTPTVPELTGYGVYGGYEFANNFGVEAEFLGTETENLETTGNAEYEIDAKTYGLYGTYKYNFGSTPFYGKAKLGIAHVSADVNGLNNSTSLETSTTRAAGGLALGFAPTENLNVEAGYSRLANDVSMVGLGAHLKF